MNHEEKPVTDADRNDYTLLAQATAEAAGFHLAANGFYTKGGNRGDWVYERAAYPDKYVAWCEFPGGYALVGGGGSARLFHEGKSYDLVGGPVDSPGGWGVSVLEAMIVGAERGITMILDGDGPGALGA